MNEHTYTHNATALYAQGKISRGQLARMLRHEIMCMKIAHEVRKEAIKKAHKENNHYGPE